MDPLKDAVDFLASEVVEGTGENKSQLLQALKIGMKMLLNNTSLFVPMEKVDRLMVIVDAKQKRLDTINVIVQKLGVDGVIQALRDRKSKLIADLEDAASTNRGGKRKIEEISCQISDVDSKQGVVMETLKKFLAEKVKILDSIDFLIAVCKESIMFAQSVESHNSRLSRQLCITKLIRLSKIRNSGYVVPFP